MRRDAIAELDGTLEAQKLLDRRLHSLHDPGLRDQRGFLVGLLAERVQGVADQVGRRLVAGIEQKDALMQQLRFRQALAVLLAEDETRQDVGIRIA